MKYINFKLLDEKVLYEKLDNGLEVFILRKKDFTTSEARFATDFGGIDIEFKPLGEEKVVKMPSGIAHFLEHKLFEQKLGDSVHEFYNKSGASVNAFTNYHKTCYYFSCNKDFEKNLTFLLDFVQSPYFTDNNVKKEKGIIKEEALMGLDEPGRVFLLRKLSNIFKKIPYKYPVVGTLGDIEKITKEDLYKCYKTFYHPSNMKLFIVTNKDEKETLDLIKDNQAKKSFEKPEKIIRKIYNEPIDVKKDYDVLEANVNEQRVSYLLKMPKDIFLAKKVEIYDSLIILFCFLIGNLSEFNLDLKKKKIINGNISYSVEFISDGEKEFCLIDISAKTDKDKEFINLLENMLKNRKCTREDFNSFKKVIISSLFYNLNSVGGTMSLLYGEYAFNDEVNPKNLELEKNLTYEKFKSIIEKINFDNKSIVVLKPKDKKC